VHIVAALASGAAKLYKKGFVARVANIKSVPGDLMKILLTEDDDWKFVIIAILGS